MMKDIEKYLIAICGLAVLGIILSLGFRISILAYFTPNPGDFTKIDLFSRGLAIFLLVGRGAVNICIGFWLFRAAAQYSKRRVGWLVFGCFFGLMAAAFFYIVRIHDILQSQFPTNDENITKQ